MATAVCGMNHRQNFHLPVMAPVSTKTIHSAGQGKCATTILAEQGDVVTVVTDVPYNIRSRHTVPSCRKGTRSMHRSTLQIPTQSYTDYTTTSRQYLDSTSRPDRVHRCGSQHISQLNFGADGQDWKSSYKYTFINKGAKSPATLHLPSFENRMNMAEGAGIKRSMTAPGDHGTRNFWSQYNRVHNKLGVMLGPGVPQERTVRRQYNPLTGEDSGDAWKPQNHRISGNRVLYNDYRKQCTGSILG